MPRINTTLQISADELGELLMDRLEQSYGKGMVSNLQFLVSEQSRGYGMGEYTVPVFNGIKFNVKMNMPEAKPATPRNSLASQIESVERDGRPFGDH